MSKSDLKKVLFVCVGNSCRSQIAEGYARVWGKKVMRASSAGTAALGQVSPDVIKVMNEEGIDISKQNSRQITREMVEKADLIVALGDSPENPYPDLAERKVTHWPTPDPFGQSIAQTRKVRDMIKTRVMDLIIDLAENKPATRDGP